ncbi:MAG: hypothetical protein FJ291_18120 [Planctomycetes bacterium]|nr:hypothetical protein [Planctomycetota bacterium]
MDTELLREKFESIGARVKFADAHRRLGSISRPPRFAIDVKRDKKGKFFEMRVRPDAAVDVAVRDARPKDRHLLLLVRGAGEEKVRPGVTKDIELFLCGHDERAWFVAAVPEGAHVSSVRQAKEALKPAAVQSSQDRMKVKTKDRNRRRNQAFVRQGEWFFVPSPGIQPDEALVLRGEPLARGGKPHVAQFVFRRGGTTVRVCSQYPNGLTEDEYAKVVRERPEAKHLPWRNMVRDAAVFVKGRITHPDHKTVELPTWHQVVPNTESQARAMRHVAFLD